VSTAQVVIALVVTIFMIILGVWTKSKIIFTILLAVSLSMWGINDDVVEITQKAASTFGVKTGWWEPFSIQTGWGAAICVGVPILLAIKTKSRIALCFMAVIAVNILGIDLALVDMVNSIGGTSTDWFGKLKNPF
jgi:hypothetical protein